MKNQLVSFVQTKEEINFILDKIDNQILFIPLNLETFIHLKKKNLFYINPKKYFDNEKHKQALDFTEKFILNLNYGNLTYEGLKLEFRSKIRFLINSCIFIIEIHKKILETRDVTLVLSGWHGRNLKKYNSNEIFLSSFIIENITNFKNIKNLTFDHKNINQISDFYEYIFDKKQIKENNILINSLGYNFYRILKFKKLFQKVYRFNFEGNKLSFFKKIIFFILGYREIFPQKKRIEFNKFAKVPDISLFYGNYDLSKVINLKKKELLFELSLSINKLKALKNLFKQVKFNNYFSFHSRGLDGSICELLNSINCTTINISHGTVVQYYEKYDALYKKIISDSVFSGKFKYFAVQSELCEKSLLNTNINIKKTIKTNNLIFSNIKSDIHDKEFLLYAVTLKNFHGIHFLGVEMFYEFFENLNLLNNIAKNGKKIIVNIHESHRKILEEIKPFFPNLLFSSEKIDNVLAKSFVLISFSSTAIEDAIASNRYVILLDQWKRYQHFKPSTEKEKNKIYYVNTEEELNKLIDYLRKIKKNKAEFFRNDLQNNYNKVLKIKNEN